MNRLQRTLVGAAIAGSMLTGGVVGAIVYGMTAITAAAATPTPTPAGRGASSAFVPNEDPAHEATESAAREAQENAGQRPTVP